VDEEFTTLDLEQAGRMANWLGVYDDNALQFVGRDPASMVQWFRSLSKVEVAG
jgi:hypothetical protein